jgi:Family of unknown function (DUF6152)
MRRLLAIAATVLCLAAVPAAAHHSLAPYIQTRAESVIGTVKEFAWTNPHTWLTVLVRDEKGEMVEWVFEGAATSRLATAGFKKDSVVAGDTISVAFNPRRDGKPGGMFVAVTMSDGTTLKLTRYQQFRSGGVRIE